jgi:hypothetical protein
MPGKKAKIESDLNGSLLTETSIKVGKALAKSALKAEATGKKAKDAATKLVETVKEKSGVSVLKEAKKVVKKTKAVNRATFPLQDNLSVKMRMGFLAGDLFHYLKENGETKIDKLVRIMQKRKNTKAYIFGAIGWLTREGKIAFSKDGNKIDLSM